ncbi:MAG: AAA family ATPase [Hydrogenothermaceae bacterium]|nr:AAA family ATPase [Hydrogenothermaceae bacterium]
MDILEKAINLSALKLSQKLPVYRRFLFDDIKKNPSKIIGLYGPRGVGKTTLLLQIFQDINLPLRESIYISCDHPIFSDINLYEFLEEFYKKGGKVVFIDEIHKIKDFQKHIKSAYDFLELKIYFSGSSALAITNPDFSRRFSMFHIPILSLREYIELKTGIRLNSYHLEEILTDHQNITMDIIRKIPEKILKIFDEYNSFGAYPFYFEDPDKYLQRLSDTINATLYFDLAEIYSVSIDKIHSLKKILSTVCVSKPFELSIEKLANIVGITKVTLYKYIEYLSRSELIIHLSHESKRFKSVRKRDKLYLGNTNLLNALCLEKDVGTLRETFFASMTLYKYSIHYPDKGDFLVNEKYLFEIGGKSKDFSQIKDKSHSYLAVDGIEIGYENKIPLWLIGFLY